MIPLPMIVIDEFRDRSPKVPLAERNHPVEALFFDRSHEAFGVRIRIRRLKRRLHHANARLAQQLLALPRSTSDPDRRSARGG